MSMKRETATKKKPTPTSKARKHTYYHKDGSIYGSGSLKAGKMHGYWEWYRKDGSRMRSGHFDNGEQVGEWITYDKEGKPFKTTFMK